MEINKFSKEIKEYLKYYVYIYIDPENDEIFYVGKGKDDRVFSHLSDNKENEKCKKFNEIISRGQMPKIEILIHGLEEEEVALRVEAAVIDLLGIDNLTNAVHGYRSNLYGRLSIEQLIQRYNKEIAYIEEPSILVRINRNFHYGITKQELYDVTRSCWKLGSDREKVKYAFAVYDGIIQEVYTVLKWFKGGETMLSFEVESNSERWEFIGNIAPKEIREKYINKSVSHYYKQGNQSPILYVNIKEENPVDACSNARLSENCIVKGDDYTCG